MPPTNEDIVDGVQERHFYSWRDFVDFLRGEVKLNRKLIWRGQSQNWPLLPSLERELTSPDPENRVKIRSTHLDNFQYAIRGRLGPNPPDFSHPSKHRELWALGQHHGLATPLLDWTESPFVGAFFAYVNEKEADDDSERVVFGLDKKSIEEIDRDHLRAIAKERPLTSALLGIKELPEVEIYKPKSHFNPNLVSQQGLFTIFQFVNLHLETWIKMVFSGEHTHPVLVKYFLPNHDRHPFLIFLNRMNINHLTLFPDLTGASKYCNQSLKIGEY
ncbi:MAG: FRG domain-containing protein [Nitrospinae bacterium]|nr:FRG domain-containing protein [Nitrospinota bacterium]